MRDIKAYSGIIFVYGALIKHSSPGIVKAVYSSIFNDLEIFRVTDAYSVTLTGAKPEGEGKP